ncbi:hypothetical protein QFC22_005740 [Naganishia vaughanmartiniae]|uniref:Uncharacterized protein n=1 Tax=Naganishia vaughanmartiniae TaxID=1424756 RepID=A0ACC2WS74_9TREE|nr:hypothetical protein QFC22_005740 [Naganishia vaughanmartiniae]
MSDSDTESVTSEAASEAPESPDVGPDTDDGASSVVESDANAPEVTSADPGRTNGGPGNIKAADKDATTVIPIVTGGPDAQPKIPPETLMGTPTSRASPSPGGTTVESQSRRRGDSVMSGQTGNSSGNQPSTPISTGSNAPSQGRSTSPNSTQNTSPSPRPGSVTSQKPSENTTQGSSGIVSGNSAGENTAPGGPTREQQAMLPPMPLPDFRSVDHLFAYMKMIDHHDDGKTVEALISRFFPNYAAAWDQQRKLNKTAGEKKKEEREAPKLRGEKADKDRWEKFILIVEDDRAAARMFKGIDTEAKKEDSDGETTAEGSRSSSDVSDSTDKSSDSSPTKGDKQSTKASFGQTRPSKAGRSRARRKRARLGLRRRRRAPCNKKRHPSGGLSAFLAWMSAQDVSRNAEVDSSTTSA